VDSNHMVPCDCLEDSSCRDNLTTDQAGYFSVFLMSHYDMQITHAPEACTTL